LDKLDNIEDRPFETLYASRLRTLSKSKHSNLTNVGFNPREMVVEKPSPWDISNLSASYGVTKTERSDPFISKEETRETNVALDYAYNRGSAAYIEPLKGLKSKYLRLFKEFNFNPLPNSFGVTNQLTRTFAETNYRFAEVEPRFNRYFNKRFIWNRNYDLLWNFTRSLRLNYNASMYATIDEPDEALIQANLDIADPDQYRRDSIWTNIRNFGRPKQFTQNFNASYTLPLRYLPFLDFVDVRANYLGSYTWTAAPLNAEFLGNTIQNSQSRQVTADLNFERFYDQFKFLRNINRPQRPGGSRPTAPARPPRGKDAEEVTEESTDGKAARRKAASAGPSNATRALVRPLLAIRRARFNFSETFETVVPGYLPQPELLGLSNGFQDPGLGFIVGLQPTIRELTDQDRMLANAGNPSSRDWLAQNNGFLTTSAFQNNNVVQNYTRNWDGTLTIEPLQDFRIEVNMKRSFTENYTETYKVLDKPDPNNPSAGLSFTHAVPTYNGALSMTYGGLSGLFNTDTASLAALFSQFEANRVVISQRLGDGRPHANPDFAEQGYAFGYGPAQQEVLLPAFLAAYRGEDAATSTLDPFSLKPSPKLAFDL
ncbi:MAG: cell surface protein SprA, partial [Lewinella sp.]|nr:cell surface protein SprA [Lewinella sp.]